MAYAITDVPLRPQTKDQACWYASAQMLIDWRRKRTGMCELAHPEPSDVAPLENVFQKNDGLPLSRIVELALDLGLETVPPMSPTPAAIEDWLRTSGPLWFAGLWPSGHVVVITGITTSAVLINDPWPPNQGRQWSLPFKVFDKKIQTFFDILQPKKTQTFYDIIQPLQVGTGSDWRLAPNLLYFS